MNNKINSVNVTEPCILKASLCIIFLKKKKVLVGATLKCQKQGSPLLFWKNVILFKVPPDSQVQLAWAVLSNSVSHFVGKTPAIQKYNCPHPTQFKLSSKVTRVTF